MYVHVGVSLSSVSGQWEGTCTRPVESLCRRPESRGYVQYVGESVPCGVTTCGEEGVLS